METEASAAGCLPPDRNFLMLKLVLILYTCIPFFQISCSNCGDYFLTRRGNFPENAMV